MQTISDMLLERLVEAVKHSLEILAHQHFFFSNSNSIFIITTTVSTNLLRCETLHVGAVHDMGQIFTETCDVGVYCHLVLPLKLRPHLTELCVCARGWHDVVHDVDVDIIQYHTVSVTGGTRHIVHWITSQLNVLIRITSKVHFRITSYVILKYIEKTVLRKHKQFLAGKCILTDSAFCLLNNTLTLILNLTSLSPSNVILGLGFESAWSKPETLGVSVFGVKFHQNDVRNQTTDKNVSTLQI